MLFYDLTWWVIFEKSAVFHPHEGRTGSHVGTEDEVPAGLLLHLHIMRRLLTEPPSLCSTLGTIVAKGALGSSLYPSSKPNSSPPVTLRWECPKSLLQTPLTNLLTTSYQSWPGQSQLKRVYYPSKPKHGCYISIKMPTIKCKVFVISTCLHISSEIIVVDSFKFNFMIFNKSCESSPKTSCLFYVVFIQFQI